MLGYGSSVRDKCKGNAILNIEEDKLFPTVNEERLILFHLDPSELIEVRSHVFEGAIEFEEADRSVLEMANAAITTGPFSVTGKQMLSPSKNKNDYVSLDPYWWPDEKNPDGLPYMFNGDKRNPETELYDRPQLAAFTSSVEALCLGYYFTDYEEYSARAALLLRTWFFDRQNKMNPNLNYAGFIPGIKLGSLNGIMEANSLSWIPDHVGLLVNSLHWNSDDYKKLREWFGLYTEWLIESPTGNHQRMERDQNGTWYDIQVASMSLFTGQMDIARQAAIRCFDRALEQIDGSGSHHLELKKPDGIHTAANNLLALFDMADLARKLGLDFWSGSSGNLLRSALDWFVEKETHHLRYTKNVNNGLPLDEWVSIFRRAGLRWSEQRYEAILSELEGIDTLSHRAQLLYPRFSENNGK